MLVGVVIQRAHRSLPVLAKPLAEILQFLDPDHFMGAYFTLDLELAIAVAALGLVFGLGSTEGVRTVAPEASDQLLLKVLLGIPQNV